MMDCDLKHLQDDGEAQGLSTFRARVGLTVVGLAVLVAYHLSVLNAIAETTVGLRTTKEETTATKIPVFPRTKFTDHVHGLISVIEHTTLPINDSVFKEGVNMEANPPPYPYSPNGICSISFRVIVDKTYSPPSRIECSKDMGMWCANFRHLFLNQSRILPHNVSFGVHMGDYLPSLWPKEQFYGQCIASSSQRGVFAMNNFQDAQLQAHIRSSDNATIANAEGLQFHHSLLWEERQTIPIFRGRAWMIDNDTWNQNPEKNCPKDVKDMRSARLKAALFSLDRPDLLDAAVSHQPNNACTPYNQTNGMDRVHRWGKYANSTLPPAQIPPEEYFTNYQTVLVLGGIGAAFRTGRHLAAGSAVILQDNDYEEWYIHLMQPFVHYIPLKKDLSDLFDVMEWVRDHPEEVKQIAERGQQFYWDYLSFDKMDEHWYEVLWKLSLLIHEQGPERLKTGSGRNIWQGSMVPEVFERSPEGSFERINATAQFAL